VASRRRRLPCQEARLHRLAQVVRPADHWLAASAGKAAGGLLWRQASARASEEGAAGRTRFHHGGSAVAGPPEGPDVKVLFYKKSADSSFSEEKEAKRLLFSHNFTYVDILTTNVKLHKK
jgi:hypothetical protein